MRRISAVLAALALIVLTASPAAAAKPEKIPDVIGDPVVYPAGEICGFDLEYRVDIDDGKSIVFPATSDGQQRVIVRWLVRADRRRCRRGRARRGPLGWRRRRRCR